MLIMNDKCAFNFESKHAGQLRACNLDDYFIIDIDSTSHSPSFGYSAELTPRTIFDHVARRTFEGLVILRCVRRARGRDGERILREAVAGGDRRVG